MTTAAANNQQKVNNSEEEKHFCRLCHGTDEDEDSQMDGIDQKWVQPCKCSGSIKWVHQGCFGMWHDQASAQQRTQCSICRYVFRFSTRLKPRCYAELPTRYWILILLAVAATIELFYNIASSGFDFYGILLYTIVFCLVLVVLKLEYGHQLQLPEAYKRRLELFALDLRLFQLELQLAELELEDGEQVELDAGPAPVAPTNSSLFEQSDHIQNAK